MKSCFANSFLCFSASWPVLLLTFVVEIFDKNSYLCQYTYKKQFEMFVTSFKINRCFSAASVIMLQEMIFHFLHTSSATDCNRVIKVSICRLIELQMRN